jgi:hypothetical protein
VHAEIALADPLAADLDHAGTLVEPGHPRSGPDEFGGVQAGAAGGVADTTLPVTSPSSDRQAGRS